MNLKDKLKTLGNVLSEGASINFPGDANFYSNTVRWSEYAAPQPGAVINVTTESDVQKTVSAISLEHPIMNVSATDQWRELTQMLTVARSNGLSKTTLNSSLNRVVMDGQHPGISEILRFSST